MLDSVKNGSDWKWKAGLVSLVYTLRELCVE